MFLVTAAVLFANLLWVYCRVPEFVDRHDQRAAIAGDAKEDRVRYRARRGLTSSQRSCRAVSTFWCGIGRRS